MRWQVICRNCDTKRVEMKGDVRKGKVENAELKRKTLMPLFDPVG